MVKREEMWDCVHCNILQPVLLGSCNSLRTTDAGDLSHLYHDRVSLCIKSSTYEQGCNRPWLEKNGACR
jgi:hypothetical protein